MKDEEKTKSQLIEELHKLRAQNEKIHQAADRIRSSEGHKGAVNVQSHRGKGATFNIYLPVSFNEVAPKAEPKAVTLRGRETLLLVDDEKGIVDVVGEMTWTGISIDYRRKRRRTR